MLLAVCDHWRPITGQCSRVAASLPRCLLVGQSVTGLTHAKTRIPTCLALNIFLCSREVLKSIISPSYSNSRPSSLLPAPYPRFLCIHFIVLKQWESSAAGSPSGEREPLGEPSPKRYHRQAPRRKSTTRNRYRRYRTPIPLSTCPLRSNA